MTAHPTATLIDILRIVIGDPKRGVELGVSRGDTSRALFEAFPRLTLYMADWWQAADADSTYSKSGDGHARLSQNEQWDNLREAIRQTNEWTIRRHILRCDSAKAAKLVGDESVDFVFIDAAHDYENVNRDLRLWKSKATKLLCGHDCGHKRDIDGRWGVTQAVTEFANECGLGWKQDGDCWYMPLNARTR